MITVAANYTLPPTATFVFSNGPNLTHTLPSATAVGDGKCITVINMHSTALTVTSAGGTISGATSDKLYQWETRYYETAGGNWVAVRSHRPKVLNDAAYTPTRHSGSVALVGGTATVALTVVTATSLILLTAQALGTVLVPKGLAVTARTAGTSFTITSADATDTSTVAWELFEPGA